MSQQFDKLVQIMARLRAPDGCPWDREQTHKSLKPYLIEEVYETLEALDSGDDAEFRAELGDLLLQVVFHAQLAAEEGRFNIDDVAEGICQKLVRRHPHVFGETQADTSEQVLVNWEKIKKEEKAGKEKNSALDGVPTSMPALLRAQRLQSKARSVGFDWDSADGAFEKLDEEMAEFRAAFVAMDPKRLEDEMGDLFFTLVNVSRLLKINPEEALTGSITKFITRFRHVESQVAKSGQELNKVGLEEMDRLWEEAKSNEP
ncbi:MAG: nucleoside triphosphate pyrophosphohydrolase [Nitrospinota bacterium]|nr:nucleoside triphosphate pyrophosphohydrolase [Nitrospinota bacterium]